MERWPYVSFIPGYGYIQFPFNPHDPYNPYNPYNPFIPQELYIPNYNNSCPYNPSVMTGVYSSFPWAHHQSYANCCSCLNGHPDEAVDVGLGQPGVPYEGFYGGNRTSSSTQPRAKNFRRNVPFHRRKGRGGSYGGKRRGKRTNRTNGQLAAKARTTKVGDADLQGVNTINTDQYSKCDFPVEYEVAKFSVIKSYSEDDIHKSIKYSVWSSTPRGNKKLQNAYHDAQRLAAGKPSGCPVFLFFSVNASGRFCGVAEMIGPVDFDISMDFWQQDKWTGSFPVRWHFVIDVHNAAFRHIKLKNNENKPVTKSRDTQEVFYRQGLKMLKIFKKRTWKKSILDDFRYYEDREKMMQEKRAQAKKSPAPHTVDAADPPSELPNIVIEQNTEAANAMESVVTNDNEETQESTSDEEDNGDKASVEQSTETANTIEHVVTNAKEEIQEPTSAEEGNEHQHS